MYEVNDEFLKRTKIADIEKHIIKIDARIAQENERGEN